MNGFFDPRSLLLVLSLVLVLRAVLLRYFWQLNRSYPPALWWANGSVVVAFGVLMVSLREVLPLFLSVVVGQACIVGGWLLLAAGTLRAASVAVPWKPGLGLFAASIAGAAWFLYGYPHYGLRTLVVTVPGLLFDSYVALATYRAPTSRRRRSTLRALASVLAVSVLAGVLKDIRVFTDTVGSPLDSTPEMSIFYLVSIASAVACTVFYVLLGAEQIHDDLEAQVQARTADDKVLQLAALVFQTTDEGIIVTEADGRIISVNAAFMQMTGYAQEELLGQSPRMLKSGRHDADFYQRMWAEIAEHGRWCGELWNRHKNGQLHAERVTINTLYGSDGLPLRRVALYHDVTQQKQSADKIQFQASHDRLTGLANRYAFFEMLANELSRSRRRSSVVALLFMDLNRFKPVNDQFGHEAGDVVLREIAKRWSTCVRGEDTLARVGGDEFALVVGGLNSLEDAKAIAVKLLAATAPAIELPQGQQCQVGTSIGIALYPHHAAEMDSLVAAADAAMYACKSRGIGGYVVAEAPSHTSNLPDKWIRFEEDHKVGVALIDQQHSQLVDMINNINRSVLQGRSDDDLKALFEALIKFTVEHFATEQRFMETNHYPGLEGHTAQHQDLTQELSDVFSRFAPGDELRMLQTTKDWLIQHIQHSDKPLGAYLTSMGVH